MTRYGEHVNRVSTPQRESARSDQVKNSAGGYVFALDKWKRLDRFLVLGSEGGTFYAGERELTKENAHSIDECIAEDGPRTVARIVEISDAGRAPKNDEAIFALAMCAGSKNSVTRAAALAALPKVCRIGTHLFHWAQDLGSFRKGWSRALRTAVSKWYTDRTAEAVAFQAVKYQQRDGWSHRDLIRLAHPKAPSPGHDAVFRWITADRTEAGRVSGARVRDEKKRGMAIDPGQLPPFIGAFEEIMRPGCEKARAIQLIRDFKLPHEAVPNELKSDPKVWEALLCHMGVTAVIRNLGKMTSIGLLSPMADATKHVAGVLSDSAILFKGRVHPMTVLFALKTYESGHGLKGSLSWTPQREIVDALDEGFYLAFQSIEPTGKRHYLAMDISGSMDGSRIAGTTITAREASAAMAMVTARSEKNWHAAGFGAQVHGSTVYRTGHPGYPCSMQPLTISPKQRLDDVIRTLQKMPLGGTNCAAPMQDALEKKIPVDVFLCYTDNETWAGEVHPFQALRAYRDKMAIDAKLVVVGMTASGFTIADPTDEGMLDVVGMDAAVPGVIADFVGDRGLRG